MAPDLRGYGATDQSADPTQYNLLQLIGDLVNLLDTLGERQAVLVGHAGGPAWRGKPPCCAPTGSGPWRA